MYPRVPARVKFAVLPYVILVAVGLLVADDWGLIDLAAASQAEAATEAPRRDLKPSQAARADIPPRYLRLYRSSARPGVPWQVLAGIGRVESNHGRSTLPGVHSGANYAGACGPMQIGCVPGSKAGNSWARYGRGSPYDPADAIPAAARYLAGHGARTNLDRAIHAYNHSWAYVRQVKALARRYQKGA